MSLWERRRFGGKQKRVAVFGPEVLKAIGEAFDAAWPEISVNFGNDPVDATHIGLAAYLKR